MLSAAAEDRVRSIGRYEVLGELGHGGMAVVYRARDPQLLREVAVKVLHPHLASDVESRKRFLREAQAAARLRHPNIVEVFDFSVEADRDSFMVTELLDGPTLRRFADGKTPLPSEIVAAIGVVLCDALACAHAMGIVHRDVKPDNILLHKGGVLKLTDFGIAHVADGNGMTMTGQILGSPAHMAPEQIDAGPIDARTDLFSLGTVLYALAVGRLPFEAPVAHALLRKILEADYVDPARAEPKVGDRFAAIIRRCMARNPDDRFEDAAALKRALCAFCAEVRWDEPSKKLAEFFAAPEAFVREHERRLLETLPELGRRARDERRIPEAMGYFNRALAIDPSNVKVLELVRSVAQRRQRARAARAVLLVTATAALSAATIVGAVTAARRKSPGTMPVRPESQSGASSVAWAAIEGDAAASRVERSATPTGPEAPVASASSLASTRDAAAIPTAQPAAESGVRVRLVLRGPEGRVAIDGQPPREHRDELEYRLSAGAHEVQLVPSDAQCERPAPWRINVRPQSNGAVQELTSPVFACHSTAHSHGASSRPAANARVVSANNSGNGATTSAAAAPGLVPVRLVIVGLNGLIKIDNGDPREHDNGYEYMLRPGPHTIQVIPMDSSCARPPPWRIEVQPNEDGSALRFASPRYACAPRTTETAPSP